MARGWLAGRELRGATGRSCRGFHRRSLTVYCAVMHKIPTKMDSSRTRTTWRERAFVLGGIAVAGGMTALGMPIGAGEEILAPVWLGAIGWTVLAAFAHGLWRGVRFGEWAADREADQEHERRRRDELSYRLRTDPAYSCLPGNTFHRSRL